MLTNDAMLQQKMYACIFDFNKLHSTANAEWNGVEMKNNANEIIKREQKQREKSA